MKRPGFPCASWPGRSAKTIPTSAIGSAAATCPVPMCSCRWPRSSVSPSRNCWANPSPGAWSRRPAGCGTCLKQRPNFPAVSKRRSPRFSNRSCSNTPTDTRRRPEVFSFSRSVVVPSPPEAEEDGRGRKHPKPVAQTLRSQHRRFRRVVHRAASPKRILGQRRAKFSAATDRNGHKRSSRRECAPSSIAVAAAAEALNRQRPMRHSVRNQARLWFLQSQTLQAHRAGTPPLSTADRSAARNALTARGGRLRPRRSTDAARWQPV